MDHDAYDLGGCSAEVKEKETGASQQYDPLTIPPLPGIPSNILIQFLAFVLFCWCLGLLTVSCVVIFASF